jgi:hypothetical protein
MLNSYSPNTTLISNDNLMSEEPTELMYSRFILKYSMQYMRRVMGAGLLLVDTENKWFYYYYYYYYYSNGPLQEKEITIHISNDAY